MVGFSFHEVMEGTVQRTGERFDRPFRFDFEVTMPDALGFLSSVVGECVGRVRIDGLAKDRPAKGTLELSPVRKRMMRYAFTFEGDDGNVYRFDGRKTIGGLTFSRGWTKLPGDVFGPDGDIWGEALLRFSMRRDLGDLVRSVRLATGTTARQAV
ncbi:MAG TPA: hypothetical protein VF316_13865 [Polyangiaceae bacterium]